MTVEYDTLSDQSAIALLRDSKSLEDRDTAATFLEVSANGGDSDTLRTLALALISALEQRAVLSDTHDFVEVEGSDVFVFTEDGHRITMAVGLRHNQAQLAGDAIRNALSTYPGWVNEIR